MTARTDAVQQIRIAFPVELLTLLDTIVPARERSRFIVKATEEALHRERLQQALEASAGAWSDEDHPDLMTVEDVDRYIRRLRETWMPRTWDEIAEEAEAGIRESSEEAIRDG